MAIATARVKPIAGDTLGVYTGEFLVSPIPLELSFNWCSHHCLYCFANLNRPGRWADTAATLRLLSDYQNRDTLTAHLLREGYPVLVSNRVDPFAASNYRQSVPILRVMAGLGIPVAIQTRGGVAGAVLDAMDFLPPSVWYLSVTTLDDDVRKRLEPGAPDTDSRFELMERLVDLGHRVVIGYNPCVREWQPDPRPLVERARDCGAEGAWIEYLHMSHRQASRLSPRDREVIGGDLIATAMKKRAQPDEREHYDHARSAARDAGLEVFSIGQFERSEFFRPFEEVYPRRFPIYQELVNHCHDAGLGPSDLITSQNYVDYFSSRLPGGEWDLTRYIGATSAWVLKDRHFIGRSDYPALLRLIFDDPRIRFNPTRSRAFAYAGYKDESGWIQWTQRDGTSLIGFHADGCDTNLFHHDPATQES